MTDITELPVRYFCSASQYFDYEKVSDCCHCGIYDVGHSHGCRKTITADKNVTVAVPENVVASHSEVIRYGWRDPGKWLPTIHIPIEQNQYRKPCKPYKNEVESHCPPLLTFTTVYS